MEPIVVITTTMVAGMTIQETTDMVPAADITIMEDHGCLSRSAIGMGPAAGISTIAGPGSHIRESTITEWVAGITSGEGFGETIPGFMFISMAAVTIGPVACGLIFRCPIAIRHPAGIYMMVSVGTPTATWVMSMDRAADIITMEGFGMCTRERITREEVETAFTFS